MRDLSDNRIGAFFVRLWALSIGVPLLIDVVGQMIAAMTESPSAEADRQRVMMIVVGIVTVIYLLIGWPQQLD